MANESPVDPDRRHLRALRPTDLCHLRSVVDVALHPSGRHAVVTLAWPDADTDSNRSVLEVCAVDGQHRRRLTDGHRDHLARFDPGGQRLVFVRTMPEKPARIMLLDWPSGTVDEVMTMADGVTDVRWLGDDRLVVLAPRRPDDQHGVDDAELARRPRILSRIDYRFNGAGWTDDRPNQVFVIDRPREVATAREIGLAGVDHGAIAPSPDGRWVAVTAAVADDADITGSNDVWLLDAGRPPTPAPAPAPTPPSTPAPTPTATGSPSEPVRLTDPGGWWSLVSWHRDGPLMACGMTDQSVVGFRRPFLLAVPEADDPVPGDHDAGWSPTVTRLGPADQNITAPATATVVVVDDGFLLPGNRRGRVGIDHHGFDGTHRVIHEGDHEVVAVDGTGDGSILVGAVTSPQRPAELWRFDGPAPVRLLGANDELLARLDLAEITEVTVVSGDGTEVHGFVANPPSSAPPPGPAGRPGLLYVHGGPMFQYGLGFFDEFQVAAACGYVVVGGNPRGSDGYGEAWAQAIAGDFGHLDWMDVTALADHLAQRPEVDADRLGIGGGSYGGFMTAWALARDRRFKAGLVERAVTSWTSMYGTSDIGGWFTEKNIGATIEDDHAEVLRQSPLTYAADIGAPTLIIHSEEDWRCPIEQAEQLFAAIRRNGGQTVMVRFPGENHELSRSGRPSHRIERFEIIHEFFARHLGGDDLGTSHLQGGG